jgi:hypothetical protein
MAATYTRVAMMRPFSNIFLSCVTGPMRNMVLHGDTNKIRTHAVHAGHLGAMHALHYQREQLVREGNRVQEPHLPIMRILDRVYSTANLVGLRKNTDAWPDSEARQMPSTAPPLRLASVRGWKAKC